MGAGPLRKDLVTGQAPQSLAGGWQVPQVGSAYRRFRLMLMVNHACNMRCTYCYRRDKVDRPMPEQLGRQAVHRAVGSLAAGGTLELGFFGGEPLLEAPLIASLIGCAREQTSAVGARLSLSMTTNGTVANSAAWSLMTLPDMNLAVSHDGLPEVHNRHRRFDNGCGSSARVLATVKRLLAAGKDFAVVMVVRPDTVDLLPAGIQFLWGLGVRHVEPTLDLRARWTREDAHRLDAAVTRCAEIWWSRLPHFSMSWFDQKAAPPARVPLTASARCGSGAGEIAVAPSGNLYRCERLIGNDTHSNPMRLSGGVLDGEDFLRHGTRACPSAEACAACTVRSFCTATCPCSSWVRTGNAGRPGGLLRFLNDSCRREAARVLSVFPHGVKT